MDNTRLTPETSEKKSEDINTVETDFKSIRESKGLTLKDIFKSTRINTTNLTAIENGDFHLLPPPVFTKSFIKIYAKTLGVDSSTMLTRYDRYLESIKTPHRDAEVKKSPETAKINYRGFFWGLFIPIIVGITIFSLSSYRSEIDILNNGRSEPAQKTLSSTPLGDIKPDAKNETSPQMSFSVKTQENNAQLTTGVQEQQPTNKTENKPDIRNHEITVSKQILSKQNEGREKYPLSLEARELTWLRITADQNSPYEIMLQPGDRIQKNASQFIIDIGNAGGINIEFQGKSLGKLGKRGEVIHLKLP